MLASEAKTETIAPGVVSDSVSSCRRAAIAAAGGGAGGRGGRALRPGGRARRRRSTLNPHIILSSDSMSPCRRAAIAAAAEMLAAEAAAHSDLVVVRGADAYRNLPNKTVRLLRYMLSSARGCGHPLCSHRHLGI